MKRNLSGNVLNFSLERSTIITFVVLVTPLLRDTILPLFGFRFDKGQQD